MHKEMTISVDIAFKKGAKAMVEVPGYIKGIKQADNRFIVKRGQIYVTLLYDGSNVNATKKQLHLSIGKEFFGKKDQVQVNKVLAEGEHENVWAVLI